MVKSGLKVRYHRAAASMTLLSKLRVAQISRILRCLRIPPHTWQTAPRVRRFDAWPWLRLGASHSPATRHRHPFILSRGLCCCSTPR